MSSGDSTSELCYLGNFDYLVFSKDGKVAAKSQDLTDMTLCQTLRTVV